MNIVSSSEDYFKPVKSPLNQMNKRKLTICLLKLATISSKAASRVSSALPSFCKTWKNRKHSHEVDIIITFLRSCLYFKKVSEKSAGSILEGDWGVE